MNHLLNRPILPSLTRCQHCHKAEEDHARADHKYKRDQSLPAWHGFWRGLGTNLKRLGVDLKTIQEILRGAHIAATADIYVKEVSEQAVEAMQRIKGRSNIRTLGVKHVAPRAAQGERDLTT
jgi:hypothetical protein